jgi:3-oxoacyl-[acyl-carrier protein] reductase
MNSTNGRVAVVTGAGSGIGLAVSHELASRGAKAVAMVDRSDAVREAAADINSQFDRQVAKAYVGDVTDAIFRRDVYEVVSAECGSPRICVPAAGITRDSLAVKLDKDSGKGIIYPLETFRLVTEVDLIAPIYWALELVARIAEDRKKAGRPRWEPAEHIQGTIIFIGSISSLGNKGQIAYAAAKAGLEGAAATLTAEAMFYGVRCGVIHPGFTDTPMVRALGEDFITQKILPQTQLRRLIQPKEIAEAICFLIDNPAVSGQLWADAGWHPSA